MPASSNSPSNFFSGAIQPNSASWSGFIAPPKLKTAS